MRPPKTQPSCLLVEDQLLVGLSLEAYLEECGWAVDGPATSNAEAEAHLNRHRPDLAIVDFTLRDGPCTDLVRRLISAGIPFLIYSGHRPQPTMAPELRQALWLEKPAARESLLRAIASVYAPEEAAGREAAGT